MKNNNTAAKNHLRESSNLYRSAGGQRDQAQTLLDMGHLDFLMERLDQARVTYTQARQTLAALGDRAGEASALRALGDLDSALGRFEAAQISYAEARNLYQMVGDRVGEADAMFTLGLMSVGQDNVMATAMLVHAGRLYRACGIRDWQRTANNIASRLR